MIFLKLSLVILWSSLVIFCSYAALMTVRGTQHTRGYNLILHQARFTRFLCLIYYSGMHPRVLVDGFEIAKRATLQFLEKFRTPVVMRDDPDREVLKMVARTTLRTKLYEALADQLTDIVTNAVSYFISIYLFFFHCQFLYCLQPLILERNLF